MQLNCDMGEGCDDAAIMPYIDWANIACGGHTGDEDSMRATIALAQRHGVAIGAHPSYPDRIHFGRQRPDIRTEALYHSLQQQVQALASLHPVQHLKAHGALYHDASHIAEIFQLLLKLAQEFCCLLVVPATLTQAFQVMAKDRGVSLMFEAFADRAYLDNNTLMPRSQAGSVYQSPEQIIAQSNAIASGGWGMPVDTLCIHSDNPASVHAAPALQQLLAAS